MLTFDHDKLIRREFAEVKRYRDYLLNRSPCGCPLTAVVVLHDDRGACCRREPWRRTFEAILLAVRPPAPFHQAEVDWTSRVLNGAMTRGEHG